MSSDESWSALAGLDAVSARSQMAERFRAITKLPAEEQREKLRSMIVAEYALDEPGLLEFTGRRLRSLLDLELKDAIAVSEGYGKIFNDMPGEMAMRRVTVVQSVAREMSAVEVDALQHIMPGLVDSIPSMLRHETAEAQTAQGSSTASTAAATKKPAWKFWQRN